MEVILDSIDSQGMTAQIPNDSGDVRQEFCVEIRGDGPSPIQGEEFTFDTISIDGEIVFYNVAWYRPPPLIGRSVEWISPQTVTLRDVDAPDLASGRELGKKVLQALGHRTGFTHMEWYRKENGEAIFGEIAARPPGARSVDLMNFASDIDLFTGWAEVAVHGRLTQKVERRYNSAIIFKRAQGSGHIQRIEGLDGQRREYTSITRCKIDRLK